MAFTGGGTFYVDYANGSDTARTALTGVTVANPSGGITRCTKTAHGLVTGAVVTASAFSSWLNNAWKITVVDANTFDLDGAVWQTTADANGTITPWGGSSWTDAWKTVGGTTTSQGLKGGGSTLRIAKSPDPTTLGSCTWTNKSATVTIPANLTQDVYTSGAWTAAANGASITTSTNRKLGANCVQITLPASPTTNTLYAYKAFSATDFSTKEQLSTWIRPVTLGITAGNFKLCLCSDALGATPVDSFSLPAGAVTGQFFAAVINKAAALGASIQSVALYSDTVAPGASASIILSNIIACKAASAADSIDLTKLISKSDGTGTEPYLAIQSITGTTLTLDVGANTTAGSTNRGYSGTTETVTTYIRKATQTTMVAAQTTSVQLIQDSGIAGSPLMLSGGWNTSNSVQDGQTYFDGQNGLGVGLDPNNKSYLTSERLSFLRYSYGFGPAQTGLTAGTAANYSMYFVDLNNNTTSPIYPYAQSDFGTIAVTNMCNNAAIASMAGMRCTLNFTNCNSNIGIFATPQNSIVTGTNLNNSGSGSGAVQVSAKSKAYISNIKDSAGLGCNLMSESTLLNATLSGNTSGAVQLAGQANSVGYLNYCLVSDSTEVLASSSANLVQFANQRIISVDHDQTAGYVKIFTDGGLIEKGITTSPDSPATTWNVLSPTSTHRTILYPLDEEIDTFYASTNNPITITLRMQKSHATGIAAGIRVKKGQLGLSTDQIALMTDTANTTETVTLTFTPVSAGAFTIDAIAYGGTTYNARYANLTVTQ